MKKIAALFTLIVPLTHALAQNAGELNLLGLSPLFRCSLTAVDQALFRLQVDPESNAISVMQITMPHMPSYATSSPPSTISKLMRIDAMSPRELAGANGMETFNFYELSENGALNTEMRFAQTQDWNGGGFGKGLRRWKIEVTNFKDAQTQSFDCRDEWLENQVDARLDILSRHTSLRK